MIRLENNLLAGIPQTILPGGLRPTGIAWHWTAGATGRAGALGTARYFISAASSANASYHMLLSWDDPITGAMWIVPADRAAHSINPGKVYRHSAAASASASIRAREAARWAEVKRILGSDAYDPNAGCIAVSFCGMPDDLARALESPVFRADVRELAGRLVRSFPTIVDRPHFGHGWIQPITRYEADIRPGGTDLLIGPVLYGSTSIPAPAPVPVNEEENMLPTRRVAQVWRARTDTPVHQSPDESSPVIATIAAGSNVPSIQEQAELRGGAWATIGPWRTVVLFDDRTGYAHRDHIDPVPAPGFDRLNRGTLYEVDTESVPAWPLPTGGGITQDDVDEAAATARALALAEAEAAVKAIE